VSASRTVTISAVDAETLAAAWLERRDREDWCARDQETLDGWLAESSAHRLAYLRLHAAWSDADRLAVLRRTAPENIAAAPGRQIWLKLTAGVAVAAALGVAAAAYLSGPREQTYATRVGATKTIALADGSRIELNTDTVLRTRITANERAIWLDRGEAYFQVKHDAAHPFVVMAADHRMTDLGTKFVVRSDADRLRVAMLEGSVRFSSSDGATQSALLTRGDVAVATAKSFSVTKQSAPDLARDMNWRQGVIVFKDDTLAEAVGELDRYNNRKLVIVDPVVARRMISGTIATTDVDAFVRVARNILGLHVVERGDDIVISR